MLVHFAMHRTGERNNVLYAIAVFRLLKAALLVAAGLGVLRLVRPDATRWLAAMPFVNEHAFVSRAVAMLTRQPPHRIEELAIASFAYAALFTTEGIGLLMQKVWAEWLTIVATTSFIPFEAVEIAHRTTPLRVAVLVLNIAIVAYLVWLRVHAKRAAIIRPRHG